MAAEVDDIPHGNQIYSSPAIGADGTIYVGSIDYNLYAIEQHRLALRLNSNLARNPAIPPIGVAISPAVTVLIQDANGNTVTTATTPSRWRWAPTPAAPRWGAR